MKVAIIFFAIKTLSAISAFDLYPLIKPQFASSDIISGVEAETSEAPYIVSLKGSYHFCAGSIISENWVLTAAHCLVYDNFYVVAGLNMRNDESQAQIRTVTKSSTIKHSLYTGSIGPNDIGLIYIETPFDFTKISPTTGQPLVSKIGLPSGQFEQLGDGIVFGWGNDNSNTLSNSLQKLHTTIISYAECKDILPSNSKIASVNICSYNNGTIASACTGDSGGPLVKYTGNVVELIGIVSWGYNPCTSMKYPSVYTHTDAYASWIVDQQNGYKIN